MSTKAIIQSQINLITAGGLNTASEAVNIWQSLLEEMFQTTHTMSNVSAPNQFTYNLRFKKIGNLIWVDGTVKSEFTVAWGNVSLVTIDDANFYAKTGQDTKGFVVGENSLSNGLLKFTTNSIFLETNIGPGNTIRINNHYQTND